MAAGSLLALLDDIATVLDDVAILSKVAAKKTAGVLGDDLALNAQQVAGVRAERELPVVWAVFMGSLRNKLILVPAALLLSAFLPMLITPLLMLGGAYLCYEGFEKLAHRYLHSPEEDAAEDVALMQALTQPEVDLVAFERDKIQGAIRTDFILSAEIIVIALGTVQASAFTTQIAVVSAIALAMTVGVYGLVALIVKLDDMGLYLKTRAGAGRAQVALGEGLLRAAPRLMKGLAVVGTAAMFLVGGGILLHGLPFGHDLLHHVTAVVQGWPAAGFWAGLAEVVVNGVSGVLAGALVLAAMLAVGRLWPRPAQG